MILVDPAIWRWRGRRWAHLVSDTSHEELHAFAGHLGLRRIWFQGDHYDIPSDLREEALRLGAVAVESRELVVRITAAGLRKRRTRTPLSLGDAEPALAALGPREPGLAVDLRPSYAPGMPAWTDLVTSDPSAAMEFYARLFGWEYDGADGYLLCRLRGHAVAGLSTSAVGPPTRPTWTTYLAEADVDAAAERVVAAGGLVVLGPATAGAHGRLLVGSDPTGGRFGLWAAGSQHGAELIDEPGAPTWTELHTAEPSTAEAFYSAVCGHTFAEVDPRPGRSGYRTISVLGRPAAGVRIRPPGPGAPVTRWVPYMAVEDVDATVTTALAAGGRLAEPPEDAPFGRWAALTDPQGALVTIVEVGAR